VKFTRKEIIRFAFSVTVFVLSFPAEAQQAKKVYRIGFLRVSAPPKAYLEAFQESLKELGYIEGKNVTFEYFWAKKSDELPQLAAELVRLKVDAIVTDGVAATLPAKKATSTIPIVMAEAGAPVETGLVASLARPGGNVTGMTGMASELGGKFLELLRDVVPKLDEVAIVRLPDSRIDDVFIKTTENPARALKIKLITLLVEGPHDYENGFRAAAKAGADAVLPRGTARFSDAQRKQVVETAIQSRLPALYGNKDWVELGGLMSYGGDRIVMWRRAAVFVDKIFKGTKPVNLPVERPTKFELVINLKTAKQIGLTIPDSVLFRADRVIK
jgi:putative ABC transport system substrate-binding protein